jgi:hypothetical protein
MTRWSTSNVPLACLIIAAPNLSPLDFAFAQSSPQEYDNEYSLEVTQDEPPIGCICSAPRFGEDVILSRLRTDRGGLQKRFWSDDSPTHHDVNARRSNSTEQGHIEQ